MSQKIGFWSVFALVTGSQIGSGIFMLPASLAPFGIYSLLGWIISGIGAVMLALVFAKLCAQFPKTGGPHAYIKAMFGPSAAFFTGWTYWVISWVSTTAVITACVGYLSPLLGELSPSFELGIEILLLFIITAVNLKGVNTAGRTEFFLTALKIIPLLIVPLVALCFFNQQNFIPVEAPLPSDVSSILKSVTLLTLWGFIGLESATTPAGMVNQPEKTIPRAVVLGTLCVAILYLINSLGIMGAVPNQALAVSKAPYADTARIIFGGNWHIVISVMASVVCLGTLNAWILSSGQIALGIAQDGLLPAFFARKNKNGAPHLALLISSAGILPLLFLTQNKSLAQQINTIIDFSVTCFLFVYVICCFAYIKLLLQKRSKQASFGNWLFTLLALAFCLWIISATPVKTLVIASLFVLSGIPFYLYQRYQPERESSPMSA